MKPRVGGNGDTEVIATSPTMEDVPVEPLPCDALRPVIGAERSDRFQHAMRGLRESLGDRVVWHVNATAEGGGVAELLRPLVGYARGCDLDWRWVAIDADEPFFEVTKRIHNRLHGHRGDGGPLGKEERRRYDETLASEAADLIGRVGPTDVVVLHDPQTIGIAGPLRGAVGAVVWRCHIGVDDPNVLALRARRFLRSSLGAVDARVFSTARHVWDGEGAGRLVTIPPSIDPTAAKNRELAPDVCAAVLRDAGILDGGSAVSPSSPSSSNASSVGRRARSFPDEPIPDDVPLVLQVSRWDRLKDPVGVARGFADRVAPSTDAHLVLVGPTLDGVADDPEDDEALAELRLTVEGLGPPAAGRVHVLELPTDEPDESGTIVNALQRRADVVCQKSLAEGFGLTVAEAMWKRRSVVASAVGGIQDQIEDGRSGLLLRDPEDLETFGTLVRTALDGSAHEGMGMRAQDRVMARFLVTRELEDHATLFEDLLG